MQHLLNVHLPEKAWGGFGTFADLDQIWLNAFNQEYLFVGEDHCAHQIKIYCLVDWPESARQKAEQVLQQHKITGARLESIPWAESQPGYCVSPAAANLLRITLGLKGVQTEGGAGNFVTFSHRSEANYYVQFAATQAEPQLYAEAASNTVLKPGYQLKNSQIARLKDLGWEPPLDMNFSRTWQATTDQERFNIAQAVQQVFVEIYGVEFYKPLAINLVLE